MENEKIYVVVPVYKVEAYLERCVESILNQTYDNYELILVDDGSPDNCPAICDQYAAKYDHITVIHQENGGLSAARNAGIEYALMHGDKEHSWINFIDSDDFVHPRYLEYLYRAAEESGTEISSCGFVRTAATEIDSAEIGELKYECLTPEEYWCRKFTNATVAWGKLYHIYLLENIRYPIGKLFEDNFTTYKLLFCHQKIAIIWTPLYFWYTNPAGITGSVWAPPKLAVLDALEEQLGFFETHGFFAARKASVRDLFWHSTKQLMYIRALSPKYDYLIEEMRMRRYRSFRLYTEEYGLWKALSYLFEIRILNPAKRILLKESIFSFISRQIRKKLHFR